MNPDRKNTIVVDFSVLPVRPDAAKVHKFLMDELKLQLAEVKQIQFHNIRKCVFIEMISFEVACRYETEHNLKHSFLCGDKNFTIHLYVDSELAMVRIHDLPPSVDNRTVHTFMQQFGTVTSIANERWKNYFPGVFNGVRVAHIRLRQPIPSYITINGHQSFCSYNGQKATCRACGLAAHPTQKCSGTAAASNLKPTTTTPSDTKSSAKTIFRSADFPSLNNNQSPPSPPSPDAFGEILARGRRSLADTEQNKQQDDSTDDNCSSSSSAVDPNDANGCTKRQLSTVNW